MADTPELSAKCVGNYHGLVFNGDPDKLTALRNTRYLGSHPSQRGQIDKVDIIFTVSEGQTPG